MTDLSPFSALRYTEAAGDPADLLAPPYDVIGSAEADALRARSPWNAVRLVLPEGPAPDRYTLASRRLSEWLDAGILAEDGDPCLYLYRQSFPSEGSGREGRRETGGTERATAAGRRERLSFFAALRLTPFGAGRVLPHEETHGEPKEDRLALTLACRAQLSPIFLVAADPEGRLGALLKRTEEEAKPVLHAATPDGVEHRLARIRADALAWRLCETAGAHPLLIADGHHRYETALAARERLPERPASDHVLACIARESDPGVRVLPTHRALSVEPPDGGWREALAGHFRLEGPAEGNPGDLARRLAANEASLALWEPGLRRGWRLVPRPGSREVAAIPPARREIGSVLFDRLVLRETLGTDPEALAARGALSYHRDPAAAAAAAGAAGAAFLLAPVDVAGVRAAVEDGGRLPPKTTYFAPKVPSGLLFRRI